jgi:DNA-binding MarR family transcriptional regulator
MNEMSAAVPVRLVDVSRTADAWGTELGAKVFSELNVRLIGLSEGSRVQIDYDGLERSDASFQREAVVETVRKHRPRLLFVVVNLEDPDIRANLELALEKRGESLLLREPDGRVGVVGRRLTPEQQLILDAVKSEPGFTSAKLTEPPFSLKSPSTASNQLTGLWKAGLIERVEGAAASGGREYRYYPIT